jgi:molybdenum cofactor synthesis domain-containing protein
VGVQLAAKILIVSDSAAAGTRADLTGPLLRTRLDEAGFDVAEMKVVSDGVASVESALRELVEGFWGLVVTSGGTGFSPRDLTPEATLRVIDREAPGLSEAMRLANRLGRLSRARAGTAGQSLVVNCPGSSKGAIECLESILDVLPHALELLRGEESPHPPETGGSTSISS